MFRTSYSVRFADVDNAGIFYYPRFFHAFHVAFEQFWERQAKRPYHRVVQGDRIGFPSVHVDADFRKPVTFGDPMEIRVGVKRFGTTSIVFRYEMAHTGTGEIHAAADITKVVVDMKTFRPMELPPHLRALLDAIALPAPG
ncbi:MAG: acyl-CoA thioesterase [Planctomycetaceae bacterium]